MTFIEYFNSQFSNMQNLDFCLRLLLACFCGAAIGFERSKRFKEAGIRTHVIVCFASALFMLISKYAYADLLLPDGARFSGIGTADPARVAAQVVTGVSFLGAGVIFRTGGTIKGLTTAASIWATAAIGLAVGAGMWVIALVSTGLVTALQMMTHRFTFGADSFATNRMRFTVKNGHEFYQSLSEQIEKWKAQVSESTVTRRNDGTTDYELTLRRRRPISYGEMKAFMEEHQEIIAGSNNLLR